MALLDNQSESGWIDVEIVAVCFRPTVAYRTVRFGGKTARFDLADADPR
jgi:hypothetical protein